MTTASSAGSTERVLLRVSHRSGRHLQNMTLTRFPVTIGRSGQASVNLRSWRLKPIHCELHLVKGRLVVKTVPDAPCFLNGAAVESSAVVDHSDELAIGPFRLTCRSLADNALQAGADRDQVFAEPVQLSSDRDAHEEPLTSPSAGQPPHQTGHPDPMISAVSAVSAEAESSNRGRASLQSQTENQLLAWQIRIQREILAYLDLRRIQLDELGDEALRDRMRGWVAEIVERQGDLPPELDREALIERVIDEAIGLGPLEILLRDPAVSEIMVNAADQIFYEKDGQLARSPIRFTSDQAVIAVIERIVSPLGRRIDEASPMVDARLRDGSRVNAVIPPLALKGPSITIRKFSQHRLHGRDLVQFGSMSEPMLQFLESIVRGKQNLVISGGTGSGKTTLLNVLSNFIPGNERIVTVEDAAELQLHQPNLVSLEARPANQEGRGAVSIRELVRNCLRMRPDRIVIGECRGGEALDMLQAMNTGHDGSLTTAHANTPRDCLSRLEVMVLMAGMDLPVQAIREQICSAVNFIVQQTRFACGSRRITSICEVNGMEQGRIQLTEIFRFQTSGYDQDGRIQGAFVATGMVPDYFHQASLRGAGINVSLFEVSE